MRRSWTMCSWSSLTTILEKPRQAELLRLRLQLRPKRRPNLRTTHPRSAQLPINRRRAVTSPESCGSAADLHPAELPVRSTVGSFRLIDRIHDFEKFLKRRPPQRLAHQRARGSENQLPTSVVLQALVNSHEQAHSRA